MFRLGYWKRGNCPLTINWAQIEFWIRSTNCIFQFQSVNFQFLWNENLSHVRHQHQQLNKKFRSEVYFIQIKCGREQKGEKHDKTKQTNAKPNEDDSLNKAKKVSVSVCQNCNMIIMVINWFLICKSLVLLSRGAWAHKQSPDCFSRKV